MLVDIHAISLFNPYDDTGFEIIRSGSVESIESCRLSAVLSRKLKPSSDELPACLTYTLPTYSVGSGSGAFYPGEWKMFPYSFHLLPKAEQVTK